VSFCEHCQGQRFDRARGLRALRKVRQDLRAAACGRDVDQALGQAIEALRALDLPHLEPEESDDDVVVH
jgi:hypothetical protein